MEFAKSVSLMSHCERLKVGAVLARSEGMIVSYGYNGTGAGLDNCCEVYSDTAGGLVTKAEVIHAEMNAIMKAAREGRSTKAAWLFLTHSPCVECAKLVASAGITTVVFNKEYRSLAGVRLLQEHGIMCYTYTRRDGMAEMEVEMKNTDVSSMLERGLVEVTFTKHDGSTRVMQCTRNLDLIPVHLHPAAQDEPIDTIIPTPSTTPVFDVIINEWRSFRNDRLISFKAVN